MMVNCSDPVQHEDEPHLAAQRARLQQRGRRLLRVPSPLLGPTWPAAACGGRRSPASCPEWCPCAPCGIGGVRLHHPELGPVVVPLRELPGHKVLQPSTASGVICMGAHHRSS